MEVRNLPGLTDSQMTSTARTENLWARTTDSAASAAASKEEAIFVINEAMMASCVLM